MVNLAFWCWLTRVVLEKRLLNGLIVWMYHDIVNCIWELTRRAVPFPWAVQWWVKKRMKPDYWLALLLCVPLSALALLVGWEEGHLVYKTSYASYLKVSVQKKNEEENCSGGRLFQVRAVAAPKPCSWHLAGVSAGHYMGLGMKPLVILRPILYS